MFSAMPFDFGRYQHYSINYTELFNEINTQNIFNDLNIQNQYLKLWKSALENHDKLITDQLNTKKSISELIILLHSEQEVFQLPINYSNTKVFLHFRASITNQIISIEKPKGHFIALKEFIKKDRYINWTPVDNVDSYSNAKDPIILVPFLINQYSCLVIDGNHRLTYKTKNNIDDIHALNLAEQSVIERELFSSSFDKFYYIMHNEINYMCNATLREKANALQLVQKSYLNGGTFKF